MKTIINSLLVVALFMTSCKKKDTTTPSTTANPPTLTLKSTSGYTSQSTTVNTGTTVLVGVTATPNTSTSSLIKEVKITDDNGTYSDSVLTNGVSNFDKDYHILCNTLGTVNYTITVTDAGGQVASASLSIITQQAIPAIKAIGSGTITLGGSVDANPSYLNLYTGTTYNAGTANTNAASIDLVYNKTAIHSANDASEVNATVKSNGVTTYFDIYTAKVYGAITAADINNYTPSNSTKVTVTNGTVVMFRTNAGKNGVFQVVTFNGFANPSGSTDNISIVGQIQQ